MRSGIATLCFCLAAGAAEIPAGAHVALQLVNTVDTRTAKVGDYVYLHTASPIAAGGHIVVPVGSYVQAVVSRAQRSGRVSGRAELAIRIETLTFPDGKEIRINPRLSSVDSAGSGQKRMLRRATSSRGRGTVRMRNGWPPWPAPARPSAAWRSAPGPTPESAARQARASAWPWCSSRAARKWNCARALPSTSSSIAPFR